MPRPATLALAAALAAGIASVAAASPADLVGQPAPPIRARPLDGDREVGLEEYRGRVVLLAFVATWCGACRQLAPELDALAAEHQARGLVVVGLTREPRERIRAHVAAHAIAIPWMQCTGRTAASYDARGLPTLVLVDRAGRVRAAHQGATPGVAARLRRDVAAIL
ncbi:MAG: TlpA family protein disulfide reductase [Sandaracinaceae bacterium]|nr:TlpA family protein disulfide reductase [Sandaracinaceae bacterium]